MGLGHRCGLGFRAATAAEALICSARAGRPQVKRDRYAAPLKVASEGGSDASLHPGIKRRVRTCGARSCLPRGSSVAITDRGPAVTGTGIAHRRSGRRCNGGMGMAPPADSSRIRGGRLARAACLSRMAAARCCSCPRQSRPTPSRLGVRRSGQRFGRGAREPASEEREHVGCQSPGGRARSRSRDRHGAPLAPG